MTKYHFKEMGLMCLLLFFFFGCQNTERKQSSNFDRELFLDEMPSREPYHGLKWEKVSGAGIEFWAQKNEELQVGISETLPGAFIEKIENGQPVAIGLAIQVFDLKNGEIEDVLEYLKDFEDWDEEELCAFEKIESPRKGVDRYVLRPTGKALQEYEEKAANEPITTTCGSWGMGNSGIRYFEIHQSNPKKALFIEIGQEAPLFDENSIIVR
ncbi:hypothetical protein SAMN00777080_1990 [Aquiflexum balticum DSM 16537]|uniref:Uncharacterized protein n=1 Tax=Aquiflexum balticum DSM 16537 TaxID=758820 RepID=A0A1W2H452_9BACT|nr:hypothetical protein [Aquiflexum balticum]SMD43398.1 hypothetical protein SAMN00777080_1990 [Aquiflexum balticum DSM 16537]